MLTGFNTDIRHRSVVLHVQTEDKGAANPFIESLVYLGGQILARKQSSYQDLVLEEAPSDRVVQRMEEQHRHMIERIRSGHLDERLETLGALGGEPAPTPAATPAVAAEPAAPAAPPGSDGGPAEPAGGTAADADAAEADADAAAAPGPTLDQVILEYLSAEAEEERLVLLMDAPRELRPGSETVLAFSTRTSLADEPVAAARVRVRMISTSSEPVSLGQGETDPHGRLELRVTIPTLERGAAALIVNASSPVGDAELKHLI